MFNADSNLQGYNSVLTWKCGYEIFGQMSILRVIIIFHGVVTQKITILCFTSLKTSNLIQNVLDFSCDNQPMVSCFNISRICNVKLELVLCHVVKQSSTLDDAGGSALSCRNMNASLKSQKSGLFYNPSPLFLQLLCIRHCSWLVFKGQSR